MSQDKFEYTDRNLVRDMMYWVDTIDIDIDKLPDEVIDELKDALFTVQTLFSERAERFYLQQTFPKDDPYGVWSKTRQLEGLLVKSVLQRWYNTTEINDEYLQSQIDSL